MNTKRMNGFTIIEVVLVLAIAALIFLMVFIAVPALQANQRDTERKNDAGLVSSAVTEYTSAYRTPLKTASDQVNLRKYVDELSGNYEGADSVFVKTGDTNVVPPIGEIWVHPATKCNGPDAEASGNSRTSTVRIRLENDTAYCVNAS